MKNNCICIICGKNYRRKPYIVKLHGAKFCSRTCKNKSQVGKPAWNKGKPFPKETREKMSASAKLKILTDEHKRNIGLGHKGITFSEERRRKISEALKGNKNGLGYKFPPEDKERRRELNRKLGLKPPILKGSESPGWRGGISKLPYSQDWTDTLKEAVRQRDNYKCQECGCPQEECIRKLHVHHIDYDKKNCSLSNLITLCEKCHIKTNHNREFWKKKYAYTVY